MRIVVKVGTSTLAHATGALNIRRTAALCRVLADIKNAGHELVLVSSGAIGMGVGKLHLPGRPADMPSKQAAAAVGQCELMYRYDKLFSEYGHTVAQVLVTGEDARDEVRSANIEATLNRLLALGALPIVNENDTVSTAEIAVGDNDTLGAIVAVHLKADLLVLLTDIDGLYTADPHTDAAAPLDVLPVPLGRLEVIFIIGRNAIQLAHGLGLQLDRPGGKALVSPGLQPLIDILLCAFQRGTFRVLFLDVLGEILYVFPVRLVGAEGKNLVLLRPIGHRLLFALAKRLHPGQAVIGLLVEILVVCLVAPPHRASPSPLFFL